MQEQEKKLTLDLPMKMEKRVFRPSTSTKRSQAAGHRVHAKSCHHMSLSPYERQHLHNSKPLFTTLIEKVRSLPRSLSSAKLHGTQL